MSQPDMSQIIAQAQQMQQQLQQAQQEIASTTLTGEAANGLVKASMRGDGIITDLAIDPKVVDPEDVETLQDLIIGAITDAHHKIAKFAEEKMGPLQQGFGQSGLGDLF